MGCDTVISLPTNVRLKDVANVIGVLSGYRARKMCLSGGAWATNVPSVRTKGIESIPECAHIFVGDEIRVMYHFEHITDDPRIGRVIQPASTPFWVAVGRRLVDFFGGEVDYNDCDNSAVDYSVPAKSNEENCPKDGKEWDDFQERVLNLSPITKEEVKSYVRLAASKTVWLPKGER
jgi:hypothetical protein